MSIKRWFALFPPKRLIEVDDDWNIEKDGKGHWLIMVNCGYHIVTLVGKNDQHELQYKF